MGYVNKSRVQIINFIRKEEIKCLRRGFNISSWLILLIYTKYSSRYQHCGQFNKLDVISNDVCTLMYMSLSCRWAVTIIDFVKADHPADPSSQMRLWTITPDAYNIAMITDFTRRPIISATGVWSVWQKRDAHDSSLEDTKKPVKDWEHKTKDFMLWLSAYLNSPAVMLSSVLAKRQPTLITITSLKNGSNGSILSAGFSAKTTGRCVRRKEAMNVDKYRHINIRQILLEQSI